MEIVSVGDQRYLVKRKFSKERIKDIKLLTEIKSFFGADTVLQHPTQNLVILAVKIEDAIILEETEF
jgi:hypothetical protein